MPPCSPDAYNASRSLVRSTRLPPPVRLSRWLCGHRLLLWLAACMVAGSFSNTQGLGACAQGSPLGRPFGRFVQAARVNVLGLVPSIAKAWRSSGCMQVCAGPQDAAQWIMNHRVAELPPSPCGGYLNDLLSLRTA